MLKNKLKAIIASGGYKSANLPPEKFKGKQNVYQILTNNDCKLSWLCMLCDTCNATITITTHDHTVITITSDDFKKLEKAAKVVKS